MLTAYFALTVFVDLVVAVNVGVVLSALLFMRRMALAVSVEPQWEGRSATAIEPVSPSGPIPTGTVIYSIEGPLFFGAAGKLERTLAHIQRPATTLILRMGHMPFVDATGIAAIDEIVQDFRSHGALVLLTELTPNVLLKLTRAGSIAKIGPQYIFSTLQQALSPPACAVVGPEPLSKSAIP